MKIRATVGFWARKGEVLLQLTEGQEAEVTDVNLLMDIAGMVMIPDYYPAGTYKVLQLYKGHKVGEEITLFSDEAGRLVLQGIVEPTDDKLWRPGRPLPDTSKSFLGRVRDAITK